MKWKQVCPMNYKLINIILCRLQFVFHCIFPCNADILRLRLTREYSKTWCEKPIKRYPTNRLLSRGYWILSFFYHFSNGCEPCKQAQVTNWVTGYPHNHFLCGTFEVGCLVVGLRTKKTTTASVKCLSHCQLFNRWFEHPDKLGENQVNKTMLLAISKLAACLLMFFFFRLQNTTISGFPVLSHGTVCTEHSKVHNELGLSCIMI